MIRSSLVKSACVAIALSGFSAPQAGALEMQGSNPAAQSSDGLISKVVMVHRGATAVGPRGGVYHRGGTYHGGAYRGGYHGGGVYRGGGYHGGAVYRGGGYRYGGWARPGWYHWGPGGAIAAGAAVGVLAAGAAAAYAGAPPLRLGRPLPMRALHPRRGFAGITPIRATAAASGTPARVLVLDFPRCLAKNRGPLFPEPRSWADV